MSFWTGRRHLPPQRENYHVEKKRRTYGVHWHDDLNDQVYRLGSRRSAFWVSTSITKLDKSQVIKITLNTGPDDVIIISCGAERVGTVLRYRRTSATPRASHRMPRYQPTQTLVHDSEFLHLNQLRPKVKQGLCGA